jgi:hypothetical protein
VVFIQQYVFPVTHAPSATANYARSINKTLSSTMKKSSSLPYLFLASAAVAFSPASLPPQRYISINHVRLSTSPNLKQVNRSNNNFNFITKVPETATALSAAATATSTRQFNAKKRVATFMAFMTGWADYLLFTKYKFFATVSAWMT